LKILHYLKHDVAQIEKVHVYCGANGFVCGGDMYMLEDEFYIDVSSLD
jgi:hypothetical protein